MLPALGNFLGLSVPKDYRLGRSALLLELLTGLLLRLIPLRKEAARTRRLNSSLSSNYTTTSAERNTSIRNTTTLT